MNKMILINKNKIKKIRKMCNNLFQKNKIVIY